MELTNARFLVVDDSMMVRDCIETFLAKLGVTRIDKVANGRFALMKIKQAIEQKMPYSLVTLDWEMPEMDGLQVLQALRSDPTTKEVAVLMITAQADQEQILKAAQYQLSAYIVKPFTKEVFEEKIRGLKICHA